MDIESLDLSDDHSDNSNEDSIDNLENNTRDWKISYYEEKNFWDKALENKWTYNSKLCPLCNIGQSEIKENNPNNLINPYYLRCSNTKCRRKYSLRYFSIFKLFRKIPASVIYKILELFIVKKQNAKEITAEIKNIYNKKVKYEAINKTIGKLRQIITEFIKIKYRKYNIGGFDQNNNQRIVAIDESLFTHDELGQVWVVGGVDTCLKNIRLDILRIRNSANISTFIYNHFKEGTHFTHDGWRGYDFLDNDINFTHETHNHGAGDFGLGERSTSHIESLWAEIKREFFSIYGIIPMNNFIYFLREIEFRVIIKKQGDAEKIKPFFECSKMVYEACKFNFSSKTDIENFNNY